MGRRHGGQQRNSFLRLLLGVVRPVQSQVSLAQFVVALWRRVIQFQALSQTLLGAGKVLLPVLQHAERKPGFG